MNNSQTLTQLYSYRYTDWETYALAIAFVVGNIVLPQLCHLIPGGGLIWLPIYFFTLIGAYKCGWRVGLLTAIASPIVNHTLFGMPSSAVLLPIVVKGLFLAITAAFAAHKWGQPKISVLLGVVMMYQLAGMIFEWTISGSLYIALQDVRIGIPGLIVQVLGGWFVLKTLKI